MANEDVNINMQPLNLLNLPLEVLEKTFSYMNYEEICNSRLVCKAFDKICQQSLNQGFSGAEKLHSVIYKEIKAKLPRRESERRSHPLARHMDLLAALETRLSLLAMTYIKYMEMGMCCFIPGKVLDEIYNILLRIRNDPTPPRPHELLTELRDISSMAMEHFEEKIVPLVKSRIRQNEAELRSASESMTSQNEGIIESQEFAYQVPIPAGPAHSVMNSRVPPLRMEIVQLRNSLRSTSSTVISLRKEVNDFKAVVSDQHRKMLEQDKKIICLNRTVSGMHKKFIEQDKLFSNIQNSLMRIQSQVQCSSCGVDKTESCQDSTLQDLQADHSMNNRHSGSRISNKDGTCETDPSSSLGYGSIEDIADNTLSINEGESDYGSSDCQTPGDDLDKHNLIQDVCGELKRKIGSGFEGNDDQPTSSKRKRDSCDEHNARIKSETLVRRKLCAKIRTNLDVGDA